MRTGFVIGALAFLFSWSVPGAVQAQDYKKVEPLVTTGQSIIGETLVYPTGSLAKITSLIVNMAPGETTGWHKHGVPLFAYILAGQVTVDYGDKGKRTYTKGMSFMEAMDQNHNGHNDGSEMTKILAVFIGADDGKNVIKKE